VIILKSTVHEPFSLDLAPLVINELQLLGSRCGRFEPALHALNHNLVDVESLIEAHYPLGKGVEAMEHAARPGTLKVLLHP
jgi:threonine dehydrogenase-like Zn-dependent dehydrogenase